MEEMVAELQKHIDCKETVDVGDIALIASEEPKMVAFAVVTDISRDDSRRDEWWHVAMQMLSVPLQPMTWTLRMPQMCGQEIFTMGGKKMFMTPLRIHHASPTVQGEEKKSLGPKKKNGPVHLKVVK